MISKVSASKSLFQRLHDYAVSIFTVFFKCSQVHLSELIITREQDFQYQYWFELFNFINDLTLLVAVGWLTEKRPLVPEGSLL